MKLAAARPFGFSLLATFVVLLAVLFTLGWGAALTTLILIAIEITFSFDNAIINAKTLARLSPLWQKLFLSVGIIIAIFGMRIVFPIVIVMFTAHLPWHQVLQLALHNPHQYAAELKHAHTSIAAFGGIFLLMLALHFFLDDSREIVWFKRFERRLQKFAAWWMPALLSILVLLLVAFSAHNHREVLVAGALGLIIYQAVQLVTRISQLAGSHSGSTGMAAFITFLYLEILDASFSFDGVIGAFAISSSVILIAAGLGAGAVWVRSFTVFMVKRGTLDSYKYLEHGAHYTVALLAILLLASILINIPDAVSGIAGVIIIGAAFRASLAEKNATKVN
jgi:hypothetical protein